MPEIRGELTEEQDNFIETQVKKGLYKSKIEYLRSLIADDMRDSGRGTRSHPTPGGENGTRR